MPAPAIHQIATSPLPQQITVTMASSGGHEALWAAIIAFMGTVLTITVGTVTYFLNKRTKEQELLIGALEFLGGGTQKRSVGIAVGRYFAEKIGMKDLMEHVFSSQMVHLKKGGHDRDETSNDILERQNYRDIEEILKKWRE
jgi:hypothetical protein